MGKTNWDEVPPWERPSGVKRALIDARNALAGHDSGDNHGEFKPFDFGEKTLRQQLTSSHEGWGSGQKMVAVAAILAILGVGYLLYDTFGPRLVSGGYTYSQFNQITEGMSYNHVVSILGRGGVLTAKNNIAGFETTAYAWQNADGSNIQLMFQNGALVQKAQAGLR